MSSKVGVPCHFKKVSTINEMLYCWVSQSVVKWIVNA